MTPEFIKRLYEAEKFDTWQEALDHCREQDRPMDVRVPTDTGAEIAEILPSGRCQTLYVAGKPAPAEYIPPTQAPGCGEYNDAMFGDSPDC